MSTPKQFRDTLYDRVQVVVNDALKEIEAHPDRQGEYAQALFEVWSRNMGAIDAILCLQGIPKNLRRAELSSGLQAGRNMTLVAHEATCKNCPGGAELRAEIVSVN